MKHPVLCSICHSKLTHSLRVLGAKKEISFLVDPCPKLLAGEPHNRDASLSESSSVEKENRPYEKGNKEERIVTSTAPQGLIAMLKGGTNGFSGSSQNESLLVPEGDDDSALLQGESESSGDLSEGGDTDKGDC